MLIGRWVVDARTLAWALLLFTFVPVLLPIIQTTDLVSPSGILDDDDDDDTLAAALSNLDLKLVAPLPQPPASPTLVVESAPAQANRPVTSRAVVPTPSRSPPRP